MFQLFSTSQQTTPLKGDTLHETTPSLYDTFSVVAPVRCPREKGSSTYDAHGGAVGMRTALALATRAPAHERGSCRRPSRCAHHAASPPTRPAHASLRCCQPVLATSTALEDQDGLRPKVKVDEVLGRVDHVRAVVCADDHVPCRAANASREQSVSSVTPRAEVGRKKMRRGQWSRAASAHTCRLCRTLS